MLLVVGCTAVEPKRGNVDKLSALLIVDAIEPCLGFWEDQLGFERVREVAHGESLGFVMLQSGSTELMLQSRASVADDMPVLAAGPWRSALYLEVADLAVIEAALGATPLLFPRRETFYGATEIGLLDPAGSSVTLAQRPPE
jgi:uncharacterized glyoxalase superfamily protein PhnB